MTSWNNPLQGGLDTFGPTRFGLGRFGILRFFFLSIGKEKKHTNKVNDDRGAEDKRKVKNEHRAPKKG